MWGIILLIFFGETKKTKQELKSDKAVKSFSKIFTFDTNAI